MGIRLISGGFLTTVQDRGRFGYQESGMSVSGVMDPRSAALANLLVGNDEGEALLEITFLGPVIEFDEDIIISVTGGNLLPKRNDQILPMYQAVRMRRGDTLSFGGMAGGSRAYVAFAGGLDIPVQLGSRSTDLRAGIGGLEGRKLGGGDTIGFRAPETDLPNLEGRRLEPEDFGREEQTLRVVLGPQDDCFTEKGIRTFLSSVYTFTNESDRMGCRLEGAAIEHKNGGDIITDGISTGAIQVPSHGQPIIMMADHQTTGGYTKIAAVISVDLPLAAQARPGSKFRFRQVSIEEAQELYIKERRMLEEVRERLKGSSAPEKELQAAIQAAVGCEARKYWNPAGKYRVVIDGNEYMVELQAESEGLR